MKKLLLLTTIIAVGFCKAQSEDADSKKLSELISIAKKNPPKKDSAVVQIMLLKATTKNKDVEKSAESAISEINNYSIIDNIATEHDVVLSKQLSDLSKEDLKGFKVEDDNFKEITFISPKQMPKIYAYIGIKKGTLKLHLVNSYSSKVWIFWNKAIFLYNGKRFEYSDDTDRNVSSGGYVYETSDYTCTLSDIDALREVVKSEKVDVRLEGSKGVDDFKLSDSIKESIAKSLMLYDKLKK